MGSFLVKYNDLNEFIKYQKLFDRYLTRQSPLQAFRNLIFIEGFILDFS